MQTKERKNRLYKALDTIRRLQARDFVALRCKHCHAVYSAPSGTWVERYSVDELQGQTLKGACPKAECIRAEKRRLFRGKKAIQWLNPPNPYVRS